MEETNLPKVIILYGPAASGKGTQAHILKEKLKTYYHLDFGTELRQFVKDHIGEFHENTEVINPNSSAENIEVAKRIRDLMSVSSPVETRDLRYVMETTITSCVERGQGMIIEGPGRLVEEAEWLAGFLAEKNVETAIYHLYLSIDEVVRRSQSRYYIPSTKKAFKSFEDAKLAVVNGEEPYQRPDDIDPEGARKRYFVLYADNFAKITSIYQLKAKSALFTIDAAADIDTISNEILEYLRIFYDAKDL